jgi:hypothetical protein
MAVIHSIAGEGQVQKADSRDGKVSMSGFNVSCRWGAELERRELF